MASDSIVIELYRELKENKIDQLLNRFNSIEKLSQTEKENVIKLEQSIKSKCNSEFQNRIEEIDQSFIDFIFLYLRWLVDRDSTNYFDPFRKFLKAMEKLQQLLKTMKPNHKHIMKFITSFIQISKTTSKRALEVARSLKKDENLFIRELSNHYMEWISTINKEVKDPLCQYKGQICLKIYNIQLGILFQKHDYTGCDSIIRHTKKYQTLPNDQLAKEPKSQQITFMYYFGRLSIFSHDFSEASQCLTYALNLTPLNDYRQRRQILKYLIPVNMYCGKFPTKTQIEKYKLYEYIELGIAIQEGNIYKFKEQREYWKKCWIQRSLYLFMGMLETLTIRNLCKRVILLFSHTKTQKSFNIDLEKFKMAFEFSAKRSFDNDEVACILGNLFYTKKYLNGFIHKTTKATLVVFSVTNPCPKIQSIK